VEKAGFFFFLKEQNPVKANTNTEMVYPLVICSPSLHHILSDIKLKGYTFKADVKALHMAHSTLRERSWLPRLKHSVTELVVKVIVVLTIWTQKMLVWKYFSRWQRVVWPCHGDPLLMPHAQWCPSRALNPRYQRFSVPNQLTYICYNTVGQNWRHGAIVDISVFLWSLTQCSRG